MIGIIQLKIIMLLISHFTGVCAVMWLSAPSLYFSDLLFPLCLYIKDWTWVWYIDDALGKHTLKCYSFPLLARFNVSVNLLML